MAELFDQAEEPEEASPAVETGATAVGIALDRARRRGKKPVGGDEEVDRFLAKQEGLIDDQRAHLHEQMAHMRLRYGLDRLKYITQAGVLLVGALVVIAVGWMAIDASRANGVVIKSFSVSPDLARLGVTGDVVASQLLDKLTDITDRSQTSAASGKFGAGWGQNISLQIPETGVSLGEVDRWLRERFGHERNLTGEIVENPNGTITLSARLDAKALPPQTGVAADLPQLILRTAELLYRREQPMTYVQYLGHLTGRTVEYEEVAREMIDSHDPVVRASGQGGLGIAAARRGDLATAQREWRAADAENAGLSWPAGNLAGIAQAQGRYEESLRLANRNMALSPHDPSETPEARTSAVLLAEQGKAYLLEDHGAALATAMALSQGDNLGLQGSRASLQARVAVFRALAHDGLGAESEANSFTPRGPEDAGLKAVDLMHIALARQDWASFVERFDAAEKLDPADTVGYAFTAFRANALAQLGRSADAQALIAPTPLDCQPCIVARGQVAEAAGRRAEADHWFGEASRMAPSIPGGPRSWGQALIARGDAARAAVQFREALRRSPRAEEAIEGLGEALALQGDAAGAAKQYAAADKLTPNWGRLHVKWGEALAKLGKSDEARAQMKTAAELDLTQAERAELGSLKP